MDLTYLYGCENWLFLSNEKYSRRVHENRMIREQFGPKQK